MPSQALIDLNDRLKDVEQLLQAHTALTQFKRAEQAINRQASVGTLRLRGVLEVLKALVTTPGKGKPAQVAAINRSAFLMLCSHLQGFVDDLHLETARYILRGRVTNPEDIAKLTRPRAANPHANIIELMFCGVGVYEIMSGIRWKNCSNKTVRERLTKYIEQRNLVAHGKRPAITKSKVLQFQSYVQLLAAALDANARTGIAAATRAAPW
jgi:hypothetical protein